MEDAMRKAAVLVEALPYIQSFRHKIIVIKVGGSAMSDWQMLDPFLQDIVFMELVGMCPILVHGGGPAINEAVKERGKVPIFHRGLRITDSETLEIVADVLVNDVNSKLVEKINELGGKATTVHGGDEPVLHAKKLDPVLIEGESEPVDLGFVGALVGVDAELLKSYCSQNVIPVVAPIASDKKGQRYNVNADSVAAAIAGSVGAEKIVFLGNMPGIMTKPGDDTSTASTLKDSEIKELINRGIIERGMIPKVEACLEAIESGVKKAHVIDALVRHSLLLEIFTQEGIGTQIITG